MKWIAVEKELPKTRKGLFVLANVSTYGVMKVMYLQKKWYAMNGEIVLPTHWQPLPEPPPLTKVSTNNKVTVPKKKTRAKKHSR